MNCFCKKSSIADVILGSKTPISLTVVTKLGISKFLREKKYKGKVLNVPKDSKIPEGHFDYALTCVLLIKA